MRLGLIFLCFFCTTALAQKPILHLIIAADVEDNAYTVRNFSKEEKLKNMFSLISKELDFNLKIKYLHTYDFGFNAKGVLDTLGKIKTLTSDDIVVFYYLGRGFYPKSTDKVPLLEFQDTKKMLSFEQLRKKMSPLKSRLNLIIADCDESYTLLNSNQLPHSLLKTSHVDHFFDGLEKNIFASFENKFSVIPSESRAMLTPNKNDDHSEDSTYREQCLKDLDNRFNNRVNLKLGVNDLKHISILKQIVSEYPEAEYPQIIENYQKEYLEWLIFQSNNYLFRSEEIALNNYKPLVDSLFIKRKITDFTDSLNIAIGNIIEFEKKPLIPQIWQKESEEEIQFYLDTFNELSLVLANKKTLSPRFSMQHLKAIFNRLDNYTIYGFPDENSQDRKNRFLTLPKIGNENYRSIDFGPIDYEEVIDSLFIKRKILERQDPINVLLDSMVEFENKPLIRPIEFLSANQVDEYYETLNKLEFFINKTATNFNDSLVKKRNIFLFDRLDSYLKIGFPDKNITELKQLSDSRTNNINHTIDFLYNQRLILKQNHYLHLKLDSLIDKTLSIHTLNLTKSEWDYYLNQKMGLDSLNRFINDDLIAKEVLKVAIDRLNEYPESGFPQFTDEYKPQIESIKYKTYFFDPKFNSPVPLRNEFYNPIIDSLYLSKQLFNLYSPLYDTLRILIVSDLPIGKPIVASMHTIEPLTGPAIRQMFLVDCGLIEIANGHKTALTKNQYIGNFTDHVLVNFNQALRIFRMEEIADLSLKRIFSPLPNPFIYQYKKTITKKCSLGSSNSLALPDFKKLPTEEKVNDLFTSYVKTNNPAKKKSLKTEIKSHFEDNAKLKVKPQFEVQRQPGSLLNISINEYFVKLDQNRPKVDSVGVKQGSMIRNKNFSKITSMMVVEN